MELDQNNPGYIINIQRDTGLINYLKANDVQSETWNNLSPSEQDAIYRQYDSWRWSIAIRESGMTSG